MEDGTGCAYGPLQGPGAGEIEDHAFQPETSPLCAEGLSRRRYIPAENSGHKKRPFRRNGLTSNDCLPYENSSK